MGLEQIAIGIRTFLRDAKLYHAIAGIQKTMPEARMIIADCGEMNYEKDLVYASLERDGHTVIHLDFDAGFGAMSNRIADALDRPYLLIGSDDFDFHPPSVREGIEKMLNVLEHTDIDVASGRVGQHGAYEFDLEDLGDTIIEHRVSIPTNPIPWFVRCDLTVNFNLVKKHIFQKARWLDNAGPIGGGEHGYWYILCKRAGYKVAYVPGAVIQEQSGQDSERYHKLRARSSDSARPYFDSIGVKRYVLGSGKLDYNRE